MSVALSARQPWAALLLAGLKTIDVRRWPTARRDERVLLHAARLPEASPESWRLLPAELRGLAELRGGIIGSLHLVECRTYRTLQAFQADQPLHLCDPSWFRPPVMYGMRFIDPVRLPFRPYPGQVRFFTVEGWQGEAPAEPQPSENAGSAGASPSQQAVSAPSTRPRLLVSVRSAEEAEAALAGGADLIDVKEPQRGSLGRADDATLAQVVRAVAGRRPISAALGELQQAVGQSLPPVVSQLAYVKCGLSRYRSNDLAWRMEWSALVEKLQRAGTECRFVTVAYADWQRAGAPTPEILADHACRESAGALLLDTWHKDGTTLLYWLDAERVGRLVQQCRAAGVPIALAGSLGRAQIQALLPTGPDWFAVRGAVCQSGERLAAIDVGRVRELVEMLSGSAKPAVER